MRRERTCGQYTGIVQSDATGRLNINGLDAGTYYLREVSAPAGYIADNRTFTITIAATYETIQGGTYQKNVGTEESPNMVTVKYDAYDVLKGYTVNVYDGTGTTTLSFLSSSIFSSDDYFTTQGNSAKGAFSVHLTAFHDLDTNRYSDAVIQPISQKDEYGAFSTIVDRHPMPASAKAVFIADRGFCSYNNMAHVLQRGQFFLFRAKDIHSNGLLHHIMTIPFRHQRGMKPSAVPSK